MGTARRDHAREQGTMERQVDEGRRHPAGARGRAVLDVLHGGCGVRPRPDGHRVVRRPAELDRGARRAHPRAPAGHVRLARGRAGAAAADDARRHPARLQRRGRSPGVPHGVGAVRPERPHAGGGPLRSADLRARAGLGIGGPGAERRLRGGARPRRRPLALLLRRGGQDTSGWPERPPSRARPAKAIRTVPIRCPRPS